MKCPSEYGKAVSVARGILRVEKGKLFDDYANCTPLPRPRVAHTTAKVESVYPNPTSDIVNFSSDVENLKVLDVNGRIVLESRWKSINKINLVDLPNGIYLLKYMKDGIDSTQKIIKL